MMELACEPASSRLKPCASLKNAPRILTLSPLLVVVLIERKQTVVRDKLLSQKNSGSRL